MFNPTEMTFENNHPVVHSSINSHARFILLGRTELTPETKTWISWDDAKLETRKMKLRDGNGLWIQA